MILDQTPSVLLGCRFSRARGCFQPVGRGKNREEAGVEHRKEPVPTGSVKKPGTVRGAMHGRDALSMTCERCGDWKV